MNLRNYANSLTRSVNPNITAQWRPFVDYTVLDSAKTTVSYGDPVALTIQTQALTKAEIQHLDSMNLSTCERSAYVNGQVGALDRNDQTGGDLLLFEGATWLVSAILEGWTTAGWCKVALTKQNDGTIV